MCLPKTIFVTSAHEKQEGKKENVTKFFILIDSVEDENDFIFDHCLDKN